MKSKPGNDERVMGREKPMRAERARDREKTTAFERSQEQRVNHIGQSETSEPLKERKYSKQGAGK